MTTYEYMCVRCNEVREITKDLRDYRPGQIEFCHVCKEPMRRVFLSAPKPIFRGKGWTGAQKRG
jgi:predicted nucleic acid-binding Zn ribbon protein